MTDMSTVLESVKNNWNKAPEELKRDVYDANYIKEFSEATRKYNASTAKPEVHQVIDWLVEGVTVVNPHYSYIPGDARWLISLWFVKRMPVTLADYFIRNTVTFDSDVEKYLKNGVTETKNKAA